MKAMKQDEMTDREKEINVLAYNECLVDIGKSYPLQFLRDLSLGLINAVTDELQNKYNVPASITDSLLNCWIMQRTVEGKENGTLADTEYRWMAEEVNNMLQSLEDLKGSCIEVR